MGAKNLGAVFLRVLLLVVMSPLVVGCQAVPVPSKMKLTEYRDALDDTGLGLPLAVKDVNLNASLPSGWQSLGVQKSSLYTHTQWRAPSKRTAVGSTYVKMPIPLSTKTLVWFAMNEVAKKSNDGKVIRRWNDKLGREWFEAENGKYHMTGYVMTRGFDAWINYVGRRKNEPTEPGEVALGEKALETFMPLSVVGKPRNETAAAK
jgi:hypothetical protein